MNVAEIIREIESLPEEDKDRVADFFSHRFEQRQVEIALKRLEDYDRGVEKAIPHEQAMKRLRDGR